MNVVQEKIDDLNAILKVEVAKEDYMPKVDEAVKKYRKNVNMKGFRQGMVPVSVVKKMYGTSILYDELNKIVTEQINKHIEEQELNILGQPLPKQDSQLAVDIQHPTDVTLEFELGLAPEFDLSVLESKPAFTKKNLKVDDSVLNEEIDNLLLRHGELGYPEDAVAEEKDALHLRIQELKDGEIKEGGVDHTSPLGLSVFKEEFQDKFLGMKIGDSIDANIFEMADRDRESVIKFVLGFKEEVPAELGEEYRITLDKIGRMSKAEMNQEFFDKVYGAGVVSDEAAFREKIANDITAHYERDAEVRLKNDITNYLLENVEMSFPDDFLKRWIKFNNEKPITDEEVEADYENFSQGLKWNLINNRIGKDNDIKAERADIEEFSKEQLRKQLEMYSPTGEPISDEDLNTFNASMMGREDHVKKTYEAVMEQKLFDFLLSSVTVEEKDVTLEELRNLN